VTFGIDKFAMITRHCRVVLVEAGAVRIAAHVFARSTRAARSSPLRWRGLRRAVGHG